MSARLGLLASGAMLLLGSACGSCPDPNNPPPMQHGSYVRNVGHSGDIYAEGAAASPYGKNDSREIELDRDNGMVMIRYQRNGKTVEERWKVAEFYALTASE